ncbi:AAA family ATPase, partial [Spongiactinospora sp. TRM90649]|uniref:AAA family ATPase n=1 Tax=Spongiactinospora sp. TRM90649 TaxID=3031114 RepID=UPI0023F999C3
MSHQPGQPDRHLRVVRDRADAPPLPLDHDGEAQHGDIVPRDVAPPATRDPGALVEPTRIWSPRQIDLVDLVVRRVAELRTAPARRGAARRLLAAAVTTAQGVHSWLSRAGDALTLGVYRRQIRAAEAAGDGEALAAWIERKERAVVQRHSRLMELPLTVVSVLKGGAIGCGGLLAGSVLLSVTVWATGAGSFTAVFEVVGGVVGGAFRLVAWAWPALTVGVPAALVAAAWREGRRRATPPAWIAAPQEDGHNGGRDVIPDEGAILNALRHLELPPLNKAFRGGWRPRFVLPTQREGKGFRTQLELPPAVTVEMIVQRKKILAHNLVRHAVEVWPTEPRTKPGVLDLWVADQGALTGPVPPWPLLNDGAGDYFKGVPVAVNIRGKTIVGRLSEANYALAGRMGSGKSTLIITLLLGGLLDPLVEADVYVMAVNADYDPMKPRLRTLMTGTGEEVVEACLNTLRGAYRSLDERGKALKEHGERAVNRRLAEIDARLRPHLIVIDECQALYMHEEYGEEAVALTVKLISAARKYGITLIFATPEASSASLPRKVMAVTSNKACFAIGDQVSNDAILGTGSYKSGVSAVGLKPKTEDDLGDVGTCMAIGFESEPGLLRCSYVSQAEAHLVVARALEIRRKAGITPGNRAPVQERDLLDDLDEVLDAERVRLADVPGLLRRLAP